MRMRKSSTAAGTFMPGYSLRHSGSSCSSGPGSITAPESECAPTAEAFSSTQMLAVGFSCFRRMAHARPAGPAPTMTTSYSMTSRSIACASLTRRPRSSPVATVGRLFRLHPDRAVQADGLAVEHGDLEDARRPAARTLRACPRRAGKGTWAAERGLHLRRACPSIIGVWKMPGAIDDAADAETRELARDGQRHAGDGRPWWPSRPPDRSGPRRRPRMRCGSAGRARRRRPGRCSA